ncbi:MAG: protein archease [Isosphaeraceae bacterium]|nr:MAG: protein archease [Isosphaeraceae bacterium]
MGRFRTFDHTADLGMEVEADSLDDLFATAAQGLVSLVVANPETIRESSERTVRLTAQDLTDLLIGWLSEVLFLIETNHEVYARFAVSVEQRPPRLKANLFGEPIDRQRHVLDHEVKAVTHHGAEIRPTDHGYAARVIVDI